MSTRSAAAMPFARMPGGSPSPNSAPANWYCKSRSACMAVPCDLLGFRGFGLQHFERRQVDVPLDQRRHVAEPRDGMGVELPHVVADVRAVRIDEDLARADAPHAVAGEMDFLHRAARQAVEKAARVEAVIA